jgi:hypothetical protein
MEQKERRFERKKESKQETKKNQTKKERKTQTNITVDVYGSIHIAFGPVATEKRGRRCTK